ncbi:hypothetical protein CE91St23_39280 [Odoribacteraceae bacterium]|nr:hypothetical protein CE91St21_40030 [Odoribacteraceae bacterium]GKH95432.1 hypothetical protein CE91St23_39280 [Odoribacteraceae bacterium]GKH98056.1 hypothetical protein CE91St22_19340 [Odoribacteraceae bacterium]
MYEKKSRAQTCAAQGQVVENLYNYEIDIIDECFPRVYSFGERVFPRKSQYAAGEYDN